MSKQLSDGRIRPRVQVFFEENGRTQQHFKDECDVNHIMLKYGASRVLEHYSQFQGNYGDFTNVQDYQTSMNQVIAAQDMFMSLPSKIRSRFNNDPSEFLRFVSDESNRDEMKTLGLLRDVPQVVDSEALAQPESIKTDPV